MQNQPPAPVLNYKTPQSQGERQCPGCGGTLVEPGFTWWGGAIGHKMLGVERCTSCKNWWVKKTGASGNTRVALYTWIGVGLGVVFAAFWVLARLGH